MNLREIAQLLRIDPSSLENGQVVETSVPISDVDTLRQLFGGSLSDEQRKQFTDTAPDLEEHPQMTALTQHVFGAGALDDAAKDYANKLLPANVRVVLADTYTISTDITQGPQGQPFAIATDNLVFDGGSLTMLATALTINAGTVTVTSGSSTYPYHIGIMGVAGTQPAQAQPGAPYANAAQAGSNSSAPTPGICTGASDGGNGTAGAKGNVGNPGASTGNAGLASYPASITVANFDSSSTGALVVQTQSGAGGAGGQGGNGGQGQDGGAGGSGCDSGCEGTDGGNGGAAGPGGDGGAGGNGANGVNGYPISISFPNASRQMLQTVSVAAPPGAAGPGGSGGPAGNPGGGGSGGKHKSDGQAGGGASGGSTGANGAAGTTSGSPGQISFTWT